MKIPQIFCNYFLLIIDGGFAYHRFRILFLFHLDNPSQIAGEFPVCVYDGAPCMDCHFQKLLSSETQKFISQYEKN